MTEQTGQEEALRRIEKAERFREVELHLAGLELKELPAEVARLTWLEILDLESVHLNTLPKEIALLRSLKELNLLDSRLKSLPPAIGELAALEYLDLSFNDLGALPSEFGNLTNLDCLDFGDCNLGFLPLVVTRLPKLRVLHLHYGGFEYLPAEIGNLTELEELDLHSNMLSSLPSEFGALTNLKRLDLSGNEFTALPQALFSLVNLEEIYAGENHISVIPSEIAHLQRLRLLDLGSSGSGLNYWSGRVDYNNEVSELPSELMSLPALEVLDLTGNPLPVQPEILANVREPSSILEAYFGTRPRTVKRKLRVFLCHSSQDKPQVRKLYKRLIDDGIDTWLDEKNLLPGQEWEYEITKAVAASDAIIVCLSNGSVTKEGYVQKEIRHALDKAEEKPEGTIFIIPALLEDCQVPQRLQGRHYVKLFDRNGYTLLSKALSARAVNLGIA